MLVLRKIGVLFFAAVLCSCAHPYQRVYLADEESFEQGVYQIAEPDLSYSSLPCQQDGDGFLKSRLWSDKEAIEICSLRVPPKINAAGVKFCPPNKRCSDEAMLPPQPCLQPIPAYYGDISATQTAGSIVLIHPYTRTQVLCFDRPGESAVDCANNFRGAGYVLITDLPQLPAHYDILKDGMYPTRRWRDDGEVVPRW